jgi:hypothetical protein
MVPILGGASLLKATLATTGPTTTATTSNGVISTRRREFTAIGSPVNVAARLDRGSRHE